VGPSAADETVVRPLLFEPLCHDRGLQYSAAVRPNICFFDSMLLTAEIGVQSLCGLHLLQPKATIGVFYNDRVVFTLGKLEPCLDLMLSTKSQATHVTPSAIWSGGGCENFAEFLCSTGRAKHSELAVELFVQPIVHVGHLHLSRFAQKQHEVGDSGFRWMPLALAQLMDIG